MSKAPFFDFSINDKSVDQLGIRNLISSIEYEEEIGKFSTVKMVIKSGPELFDAYYLLKHGGVFQLSMGYYNSLVKKMGVLFYQGVEPNFEEQAITITFADYVRAMDVGEKDRVLKGKTIEQVVQAIVADYAVLEMGVIDSGDLVLSENISQSKQTDFSLLQKIAQTFGMTWKLNPTATPGVWSISLKKINFDDDSSKYETFYVYPDKEGEDLQNNIHLKNFKPKSNILGDVPSQVNIESNNPNQPISVDSKSFDSDVYGDEVRGSEIVFTVFGQVSTVHFYENVTDEEAAQVIADQMLQMDELKFVQAKNTQLSEGNAGVRIGQRRHVIPHGIPMFSKVFEGDYLVSKTKHRVDTQSGYDTWVDLSRESLSMPPPPELPQGGGGGGQPVIIRFNPDLGSNGELYGWYVSFPNGVLTRGEKITHNQIINNDYWMSHVNSQLHSLPITPYANTGGIVFTDPLQQSVQGTQWYHEGMTVRIDFPDQWSTMPLADNVREPADVNVMEFEVPLLGVTLQELTDRELELQAAIEEQEQQARYRELGIGGYGTGPF